MATRNDVLGAQSNTNNLKWCHLLFKSSKFNLKTKHLSMRTKHLRLNEVYYVQDFFLYIFVFEIWPLKHCLRV